MLRATYHQTAALIERLRNLELQCSVFARAVESGDFSITSNEWQEMLDGIRWNVDQMLAEYGEWEMGNGKWEPTVARFN